MGPSLNGRPDILPFEISIVLFIVGVHKHVLGVVGIYYPGKQILKNRRKQKSREQGTNDSVEIIHFPAIHSI